ncbi:MAG TPA: NAD(P)/FAD-dependent oxidoreductase, partial [Turneriella sp.]|nr:NAD(P)/FAD-dependent oxidoreductase [Turneriella sp.]
GYIGLEIAMAYNRLGVKVRIIEFTDRVLRTQSEDISAELEQAMRSEGIEILPNFRAIKFEKREAEVIIHCKCKDGSMTQIRERGRVLVASGTRPNTAKLGIETVGLETDASGHIKVNDQMGTNVPHIYAVGDVANTPPFVYTAAYEGRLAVENAFTETVNRADYTALPWVVFTDPQVAGVGMDEMQAAQAGLPYDVSKLELTNLPRAIVANDTRGFIKLIRHRETDRLLGGRIVASEGGELVQSLAFAIKFGITVKQLSEELYPYLTLSEGLKLAAIGFRKDVKKLSCCAS